MQRFVGRKKKNSMKFTEQKKRVEKKMVGTTIPPHQTKKKAQRYNRPSRRSNSLKPKGERQSDQIRLRLQPFQATPFAPAKGLKNKSPAGQHEMGRE